MAKVAGADARDDQTKLLEFLAGLSVLGTDADESDRLQLASRVGVNTDGVARIFGKTHAAAQKALERAKKK